MQSWVHANWVAGWSIVKYVPRAARPARPGTGGNGAVSPGRTAMLVSCGMWMASQCPRVSSCTACCCPRLA